MPSRKHSLGKTLLRVFQPLPTTSNLLQAAQLGSTLLALAIGGTVGQWLADHENPPIPQGGGAVIGVAVLLALLAVAAVYRAQREIDMLESGPYIRVSPHHRVLNIGSTDPKAPFFIREGVMVKVWNASRTSTGSVVPWVEYFQPDGRPRLQNEIRRTWVELSEVQGSALEPIAKVPPAEHQTVALASTGIAFDVLIAEGTLPKQGNRAVIPVGGPISNILAPNQRLWACLRIAGEGMPFANKWWFTFQMRVDDKQDAFLEIEESPEPDWAKRR